MDKNSINEKIIYLKDKGDYQSLISEVKLSLRDMEISLREFAMNLVTKSEFSNWNREVKIGHIEAINDSIFEESNDANVKALHNMAQKLNELSKNITEDNTM